MLSSVRLPIRPSVGRRGKPGLVTPSTMSNGSGHHGMPVARYGSPSPRGGADRPLPAVPAVPRRRCGFRCQRRRSPYMPLCLSARGSTALSWRIDRSTETSGRSASATRTVVIGSGTAAGNKSLCGPRRRTACERPRDRRETTGVVTGSQPRSPSVPSSIRQPLLSACQYLMSAEAWPSSSLARRVVAL